MKKIIALCEAKYPDLSLQLSDFLKLRLRGRGSGFKEGPENRGRAMVLPYSPLCLESQDPIHLCVSSKFQNVFRMACKCVEDLLSNIYEQYSKFKSKKGWKRSPSLKIKKIA